jgi:L-aminopeptidase/D-esterase-like protein
MIKMIPNDKMSKLFEATAQATEESILNALVAAETMVGKNNTTVYELPEDRLIEILKKYNRIKK